MDANTGRLIERRIVLVLSNLVVLHHDLLGPEFHVLRLDFCVFVSGVENDY